MGHGWGLHGGTWKMGKWGQSIILEMLHVSMGYVSWAWVAHASKHMSGCLSKLDMFWWVVGCKVLVLKLMHCDTWFSIGGNEC